MHRLILNAMDTRHRSSNLSATPVTRSLLGICKSTVKGLYCQLPITQLKHMISLALTLSPYPQLTAV